jgi:hypothetical protein
MTHYTSYSYTGNEFSIPWCQSGFATEYANCVAGHVTATVTFQNLPAGYTGSWTTCNNQPGCTLGPYIPILSFSMAGAGTELTNNSPNVCFPSSETGGVTSFQFVNARALALLYQFRDHMVAASLKPLCSGVLVLSALINSAITWSRPH